MSDRSFQPGWIAVIAATLTFTRWTDAALIISVDGIHGSVLYVASDDRCVHVFRFDLDANLNAVTDCRTVICVEQG